MHLKRLVLFALPLCCAAILPAPVRADWNIDAGGQSEAVDGTSVQTNTIYVGRFRSDNSLSITNGGAVVANTLSVGDSDTSRNNTLLVSGSNSTLLVNQMLKVGAGGTGNTLSVGDGAWTTVGGVDANLQSNYTGGISVGNAAGNATLSAGNGSTVSADNLFIGAQTNDTGTVALSGSGTKMTIADSAYVGYAGSESSLSVGSGSTLTVSNLLQVGSATGTNNTLAINSGGTVVVAGSASVVDADQGNAINVNSGGHLTYDTAVANLDQAADNGFIFKSGSTLEVGGQLVYGQLNEGLNIILNGNLNTNYDAIWDTGGNEMVVGGTNGNNTLTVKDGATARTDAIAQIGAASGGNRIDVTGTNSQLLVGGQLLLGANSGSNNKLVVSKTGSVASAGDLTIGNASTAAGNEVDINDEGTALSVGQNIYVGYAGDNNKLVLSGGQLAATNNLHLGELAGANGNSFSISGSNAVAWIGGELAVGYAGDNNAFTANGGATTVGGDFIIGLDGTGNTATLAGSNTTMDAQGLLVGGNGGSNTLTVKDGASLLLADDALVGTNSADNTIEVTGSNSFLQVAGNLLLGNMDVTNAFTNNTLSVLDAATAEVGGNMDVGNGSFVNIQAGSQLKVAGGYTQDATSILSVSVGVASMNTTNLAVAGTASFASNSTINVFDDGTAGQTNSFRQTMLSSSGLLLGGTNATTAMLSDTNVIHFVNDLLGIDASVTNNDIVLETTFLPIAGSSGLVGSPLEPVANEIDDLAKGGNAQAIAMRNIMGTTLDESGRNKAMNDYYGQRQSASPIHNMIGQGVAGVASELTRRGDSTRERMGAATAAIAPNKPQGAEGPHSRDQLLQGWVSGFGNWYDKSAADGFSGYNGDVRGFLIGGDLAVSRNLLVGIAGGSSSATADKDNGAHSEAKTSLGAVYGSLGTKDWFLDGSLVYAASSIDNTLGDVFDTTSSYDAKNYAAYIGGGKEIICNYFIVVPQASLLANYYTQDAYSEKSSTAVPRAVDGFDNWYLQSSLGCNVGLYIGLGEATLKPELRLHWLHEFNADEQSLPYRLVGGTGEYQMYLQGPNSDIIELGLGASSKLSEYMEVRVDLDLRKSSDYSDHTLLGSLRYQF